MHTESPGGATRSKKGAACFWWDTISNRGDDLMWSSSSKFGPKIVAGRGTNEGIVPQQRCARAQRRKRKRGKMDKETHRIKHFLTLKVGKE